jgi:hypothetical protein
MVFTVIPGEIASPESGTPIYVPFWTMAEPSLKIPPVVRVPDFT